MAIREFRLVNYRAFADTGHLRMHFLAAVVGQNDTGKSAILHGLKTFFEPPKKGIPITEVHLQDGDRTVEIEVAFDPSLLPKQEVQLDAKTTVELASENLLDNKGLLRCRVKMDTKSVSPMEIKINDFDDPELFGMAALLKEKELIPLLEARKLEAKKSGKEKNREKRDALREQCTVAGVPMKEDWILLADKEKAFRAILPDFRLFTDEARYGIGETPVQNQFKGIVDRALRELPEAGTVEGQVNSTLQEEFSKVFSNLSELTKSVKAVNASANIDWKKAVGGINLTWLDSYDCEVPYELRGAGIRRLFMVAYFQYESSEGLRLPDGQKYVFCIEEPEVHLHPGAQRVLLDALKALAELGHSVVFTTHSPVFAGAIEGESLILVSREASSAQARQLPAIDLCAVGRELGVEASDHILGKHQVVLVEGKYDEAFYAHALRKYHAAGHTTLDPEKTCFLQCGGDGNLAYVVTRRKLEEVGMPWAIIRDSDKQAAEDPEKSTVTTLKSSLPRSCSHLHVIRRTTLENFYHPDAIREATGFDVDVPAYGPLVYTSSGNAISGSDYGIVKKAKSSEIVSKMNLARLMEASALTGSGQPADSELKQMFDELARAFANGAQNC